MRRKRIQVQSSAGPYDVVCGAGILRNAAHEIRRLGAFSSLHVLSSPRVWHAVGKSVRRALGMQSRLSLHLSYDAEAAKNLRTVEEICRSLSRSGADRKSVLVAVGGGVVGDIAGFVAATYLRGVSLIQVPTTLIAQVDSALGGKTGVNLPEGKNLIGAFYPPRLVLADFHLLRSLPSSEFRGGLAEVIKYGIIADEQLFCFLEKNFEQAASRDPAALRYLIPRCIEIKAGIVSRDERETGLREILNFGHTFGHALESLTHYRRYQHGEAVAWGMMAAALLGHEVGVTPADEVSRIVALVRRMGPLPPWPRVPPTSLIAAMHSDKKARGGNLRFVLTPRIGKARSFDDVQLAAIKRVFRFAPHFLDGVGTFHG